MKLSFYEWCIEQYNKYPDMIEEEAKEEGVLGDIARLIIKYKNYRQLVFTLDSL